MTTEFYPLSISKVEELTKDSTSIEFDLPINLQEKFKYYQGQHLTLKTEINGKLIRRSYSICRGADKQILQIAIKSIENGVFSNYAKQMFKSGMVLELMPPQGTFYTQLESDKQKKYCLIAVGSGVTPILSHIETILSVEKKSQITFLYGNRSTASMMFRDRLCFLKNQYLERFNWLNFFSKEENEIDIFNGRITPKKLIDLDQKKAIEISSMDQIFICGPEIMTLKIAKAFEFWGFDPSQIHYELFFSDSAETEAKKQQTQRVEKYGKKTAQVSLKISGRKNIIDLEMGGKNILDAAIESGADLPFSCKSGVCATCKAKVLKGKVEMDSNHSLSEQEVAEGMILTCQSHPVSDEVVIDFDFN